MQTPALSTSAVTQVASFPKLPQKLSSTVSFLSEEKEGRDPRGTTSGRGSGLDTRLLQAFQRLNTPEVYQASKISVG